ncbi:trigger factor [Rubritalea marina]|uniref:trigger factor n=1 Tax=Rubritalea marina TaxID=361055 RepID=UPI00036AA748|nr:trigger factor [Rubritalea marina]
MNITVEKSSCAATLNVEVPADKVASERQNIVKSYVGQANIPGFRKGKAPVKVIEKRFENEIKEELTNRLVQEGCQEAIKQEELKVLNINAPEAAELNDDGTFTFNTSAILAPEFELPEYMGLEIEVPSSEVTDEDVDNSLTELQQRFADFKDVEDRGLEDEDFAVVDFTASIDGKPVAEAIGKPAGFLDGREGHWVKIEEDSFLPNFGPQLKDLKVGDEKEVTVTIGEDFPLSEVRGKDVSFAVTVKEIKLQELPELDDEFAGKLLPEKGIEELKEVIREQLQQEKQRAAEDAKVNQIVEQLNQAVDFDLPEELVAAETQGNIQSMAQRAMQQGMTPDVLESQKEELEESAAQQAKTNLKTNFLLQEIAFKEEIKAEDQDVLQRIYQMAQQENKAPKKYIKELQKANAIQNVRNSVLIGKTIDFLVENAKVSGTTENVTEENADA